DDIKRPLASRRYVDMASFVDDIDLLVRRHRQLFFNKRMTDRHILGEETESFPYPFHRHFVLPSEFRDDLNFDKIKERERVVFRPAFRQRKERSEIGLPDKPRSHSRFRNADTEGDFSKRVGRDIARISAS